MGWPDSPYKHQYLIGARLGKKIFNRFGAEGGIINFNIERKPIYKYMLNNHMAKKTFIEYFRIGFLQTAYKKTGNFIYERCADLFLLENNVYLYITPYGEKFSAVESLIRNIKCTTTHSAK